MIKYLLITIFLLTTFACGSNDSDNISAPTPAPTPTPTPTPVPEGYSETVKNLFFELCLPAANNEFCECSVEMIEENIPVDEFPVEDLMSKILSGEISDETNNNDIVNLFPASVIEAVSPCLSLMIEDDIEIDIEENDIEIEIETENLEILSKDELLKPLLEVCLTNQSEEFCKCTTETISENYSQSDLVKLRESVAGGELPGEVFQLGLMNCAIYLGQ